MTPYGFATQLHYGEPVEKLAVYAKEKPLLFAYGGSLLIHREVFFKSGGLDEDFFAYYEDVDLGIRLWVLGYAVFLAPKALVRHRHNSTGSIFSSQRKKVLLLRNRLFFCIKILKKAYISASC